MMKLNGGSSIAMFDELLKGMCYHCYHSMIVMHLTKHCSTIMASCWQVPGGPVGNFHGSMGHPACPLPRTGHGACGRPMEIQQKPYHVGIMEISHFIASYRQW